MNASQLEAIPAAWDDDRDTAFFLVTAGVFSAGFCARASALLSGFDAQHSPRPAARDLVPVPARRLR